MVAQATFLGMEGKSGHRRLRRSRALPALLGAAAGAALFAPCELDFVSGTSLRGHLAGRAARPTAERAKSRGRLSMAAVDDELVAAKAQLTSFLADEYLAQEVLRPEGKPTRGRMDEAIVELERLNPTKEPVYSDLVDGKWTVKYTGTYAPGLLSSPTRELALFLYGGGFSLGNALSSFASGFWGQSAGLKVVEKTVRISGGRDVQASAKVEFGGQKETLTYSGDLMPLSGRRMSEEVVSVDLPAPIGRQDAPVELRRTILVTYLDEEIMVVRDESGVPEVLTRDLIAATPVPATTSVGNATEIGTNSTGTPKVESVSSTNSTNA